MRKLTSTQVLGGGFAIILCLLVFSAVQAYRLQRAGGEQQGLAYHSYIQQDDAITAMRRTIWLGGIYARDFFLNRSAAGRARFRSQLASLELSATQALTALRANAPGRLEELEIDAGVDEFLRELRNLDTEEAQGVPPPDIFIEEVLTPRRLALLALIEDLRAWVRQDLVDAQEQFAAERAAAARNLLFLLGTALFFSVMVALVSFRYARKLDLERQRHFEATALAKLELENLSSRILEVQEQERRSLSQELHDEVGQTLTALRMELSHAISRLADEVIRERLMRARQLTERTVQMVRDISLMLRPSLLDDLGLGPALQWQIENFSRRSGIQYAFDGAEAGEHLPDDVKTCVFRIAQETLNNCEKYAHATSLRMYLRHDSGRVSLEVQDDGVGFQLGPRGLPIRGTGILGMRERAIKLGGTLTVESRPGAGTRIGLVLPVDPSIPDTAAAKVGTMAR